MLLFNKLIEMWAVRLELTNPARDSSLGDYRVYQFRHTHTFNVLKRWTSGESNSGERVLQTTPVPTWPFFLYKKAIRKNFPDGFSFYKLSGFFLFPDEQLQ